MSEIWPDAADPRRPQHGGSRLDSGPIDALFGATMAGALLTTMRFEHHRRWIDATAERR